jgi:hypothetical protein
MMPDRPELTRLRENRLATGLICSANLAREGELALTKWFGYRYMSPWAATVHFLEVYQVEFRRAFAAAIDRDRAESTWGARVEDLMNNAARRTQAWRARQRADEIGMTYQDYISLSFDFALRRNRQKLPQPNQLHHPKAGNVWIEYRDNGWRERLIGDAVAMPSDAAYRINNYRGHPAQDRYRKFAFALMEGRYQPWHRMMQSWTLRRDQIPLEEFHARIKAELFETEVKRLESEERHYPTTPDTAPIVTAVSMWPSCHGLPATSMKLSGCDECPESASCKVIAKGVANDVLKSTGTASPVEAKRRADAAERQRRRRALKRAGATASGMFP